MTIAGVPEVHLTASASGTDSDWAVKLIHAYLHDKTRDRDTAGYDLAVAMDIFC